jgi:hypothetical protein
MGTGQLSRVVRVDRLRSSYLHSTGWVGATLWLVLPLARSPDPSDVDVPLAGRSRVDESRCHTGYTSHFSLISTYSRLSSRGRCAGPLWRWENGAFVRDADMSVMP